MNPIAILLLMLPLVAGAAGCPSLLKYQQAPLEGGEPIDFCKAYQGQVILAVNTASQCGYTGQLKGLEALYQRYKGQGLVVLGFPSNDFKQEYANAEKTNAVARKEYGVTFPLLATGRVKGDEAGGFFKALGEASHSPPQWNFFKYLVGRNGEVIKAYPSAVSPEDPLLNLAIEAALAAPPPP